MPGPAKRTIMDAACETAAFIPVEKSEHYLKFYEELLGARRDDALNIVELGIHHGGSTILLAHYFQRARILSIDITRPPRNLYRWLSKNHHDQRVAIGVGSQGDREFLRKAVQQHFGEDQLDVVIDDASHLYAETVVSYEYLFSERLCAGGWYFVEDWGCGYWPKWADGDPDGCHGLVRFVKERIDEEALFDRSKEYHGQRAMQVAKELSSPIARIVLVPGILAMKRARRS